ncbi:heparan-alpha-glucosaminide N-acetyltransferase domain-containing protein, partial [Stutzerimonas stutzeri]|uniref:heparan-alpha-glucosaminide N-acetyltransferase domain-containing protein n=1 Tax=Stutzerimonas stutzeri TaxID=316 RepID=UPI001BD6C802
MHGLDLARSRALAGMVLVNFRLAMAVPAEGDGWLAGFFHLLEGKASATFVTLAGLGLVLATRSLEPATARLWTLRRALFLLVAGGMNLLIFPADIIHYYAVYFVLAIAWLQAGARALLAGMAAVAVLSAWALLQLDYSQGWDWASLSYQGLWEPAGFARNLLFNGFHPVLPWLCFFLLGMLLARLPLSVPRVQRAVLMLGLLLIVAGHGVQHLA